MNDDPVQEDNSPEEPHAPQSDLLTDEESENRGDEESDNRGDDNDQEKFKNHAKNLEEFLQNFQESAAPEEKLRIAMDFMRDSLAQQGTPYFKGFWEARQLCLPLFKENLPAPLRAELWKEYRELCNESHRLKQLLEEQSAFAVEQIDLAIQSLETEIEQFDDRLHSCPPMEFPAPSALLEPHMEIYENHQKELYLLNAYASRVNALRKELIKTEMRIRQKNKFFRRLSAIGDKVFPRRKELIKTVSTRFLEDVETFVAEHFGEDALKHPLYYYREEIKALQGIAKVLTLNTHAFTHTRAKLSECWDKVREIEKERKKVRAEQKAVFQQNASEIYEKIDSLEKDLEGQEWTMNSGFAQVDEIIAMIQRTDLGKDEKKAVRERLNQAKQPLVDKLRQEEQARSEKELAVDREKKERVRLLKERTDSLLAEAEALSVEDITAQKDQLLQDIQASPLSKVEKMSLEKSLKPLRDLINEKKERAVLSLSLKDQETLDQLKQLLKQRRERRKEIKAHLEELRKAAGSSGLNFEKAMTYNERVRAEKETLEKIDAAIDEIEAKIGEIEGS